MTKLVKFDERKTVDGFTFQKGWWGEFSPTGELVTAYAYPFVSFNFSNWSYWWTTCKAFYPFDGGFVGDIFDMDQIPEEVQKDFDKVAEQEVLDQKERFLEYYGE